MDDDIWCQGELKGDSDIAGRGVVCSIWTTTALAIIISWVLWGLALWQGLTIHNSRFYRAPTKSAFVLADIQLATALAITTSSIILIRTNSETSLYHACIARCLAQANFTGYGAALTFHTRTQSNRSLHVFLLGYTIAFIYTSLLSALMSSRTETTMLPSAFTTTAASLYSIRLGCILTFLGFLLVTL